MIDLFAAASERLALETGIPVSQARSRILGTDIAPSGPLFADPIAVADGPIRADRRVRGAVPPRVIERFLQGWTATLPPRPANARYHRVALVAEGPVVIAHGPDCWCDPCCDL